MGRAGPRGASGPWSGRLVRGRAVGRPRAVEQELEDGAPERVARLRGEERVDQAARHVGAELVRENCARAGEYRRKRAGALDVEVGVDAAVVVHDEVARGVAPLDVRRVRVVGRQEPRVLARDELTRRVIGPLHELPPRVEVEQPSLPPPVKDRLRKAGVLPALVDEPRDRRRRGRKPPKAARRLRRRRRLRLLVQLLPLRPAPQPRPQRRGCCFCAWATARH